MKKTAILIVDDRPENLLTLESLLASPDLNIVQADSGNAALAHTFDHEFALILMDVQMPGMDGYETAALLRGNKKTRHIPIIFVTAAQKEEAHVFKGYGAGAVDYLFKPLQPDILNSKVHIFLDLYRQRILLEEKTRKLDAQVVELERLKRELEASNAKLKQLSSSDGLTHLPNRRYFDEMLTREWQRGIRDQTPLSLIMADIDHFKAYNDHYGHVAGDDCLKQVARQLQRSMSRAVDTVARYGGEEFAFILPDTDRGGGEHVAQRVLTDIQRLDIPHALSATADHITISIGVGTVVPSSALNESAFIDIADQALYLAKNAGRNRYEIKSP